jgi:DNA (cytosine-5)-methyltransferase 1
MNKKLTLGSLFSGSGGFELAAKNVGIETIWNSDIEPFAVRVTTKRFPEVKYYGDISTLRGENLRPVDIITFGSPCVDLSIAGKRAGINAERSGLFFQAIRIIKEMRCATNGKYPRYAVWENVPGAFSSNKGEDFRRVLEEFCKVKDAKAYVPELEKWEKSGEILGDNYSIAYMVLDAQLFGLAQRRKRIYLVADFDGESAGKILFERKSVSGNFTQSSGSRKETARSTENCSSKASEYVLCDQGGERMDILKNQIGTLRAKANHPPLVFENRQFSAKEETPKTLKIRCGGGNGGKGSLIQENKSATLSCNNDQTLFVPTVYVIGADKSNAMLSDNPESGIYEADTSRTLDVNGGNPSCNQGEIAIVDAFSIQGSMIGRADKNGPQGSGINREKSFTIDVSDRHSVAYGIERAAFNQGKNALYGFQITEEKQPTMVAKGPGAVAHSFYPQMKAECQSLLTEVSNTLVNGTNPGYQNGVVQPDEEVEYVVRRLVPQECAKLQGFPYWWCDDLGTENPTQEDIDFWTEVFEDYRKAMCPEKKPKTKNQIIKWLKNPYSDTAAYKLYGNAIAVPCGKFVLSGIAEVAERENV